MKTILPDEGFSRRKFLRAGAGALGASLISRATRAKASGTGLPNILIILTDQEREDIPRTLMHLPNRARLERRGIRFTHNFVTAPQCSASRSTLLTGLYPHQAGVVTNVDQTSLGRRLSPDVPTLGKAFAQHGYNTAYLGKWHLTDGLGGGTHSSDDSKALQPFGFEHYHFLSGAPLADAAAAWLSKASSRPWLLIVSFPYLPHDITGVAGLMPKIKIRSGVTLPPNFNDDLGSKPAPQEDYLKHDAGKVSLKWGREDWLRYRSYYLDLIEQVDQYMGVILGALSRRGDAAETVVIYTSDHGDMDGAHHLPFKGPFMYDELLRVPLVISWPRRFRQAVVSNSMVSSIDLASTLAAIAGIEWPTPLPGKDFSLLFDDPKEIVNAAVFAEYYGKQHWVNPIRTIRTARWKYNLYVAPGRELAAELYDLQNDPGEIHNLASSPQRREVLQQLAANLLDWRRNTNDPLL